VPSEVEAIVFSCLEKQPDHRCPSAEHLTAALTVAERRELSGAVTATQQFHGADAETLALSRAWASGLSMPVAASRVWIERGKRWWPAAVVAIALIAGVAIWNAGRNGPIHSLAIPPFVNASGDASLAYIADGIPESIQRDLSGASGLRLAPRSPADLKTDAVLTGVLKRENGGIAIEIRLIGKSGAILWKQIYRRPASELISLEESISSDLATHIQTQPVPQQHAGDARAYDLYLKGRHRLSVRTLEDLRQAILYFQQATAAAPDFALAWAGIGEAYALIANFGTEAPLASLAQAKAASLRALKLDSTIPEAHTSYGFALAFSDHNLTEAERSLRKAIDLNPNLAEPHSYLAGAVLTPLKRFDEATIEIQRAIDLAPGSSILRLVQINNLYMARRYDAALELLGKADPGFLPAEVGLERALNLIASGRPAEAIEAIQAAVPDISVKWLRQGAGLDQTQLTLLATLAYARAQAGQTAEVDRLEEYLDRQATQTYVSQCDLAFIDISRRRTDGAIRRIERCVADRAFESLFLQVDPRYDPIRLNPRFPGA
jgi:TolB-like protein